MNNEIRLIKKEQEQASPQKESPVFKRKDSVITANSPIIKRLKEAEERNKNRRELSDDELIELEFKEEADKIRAQKLQDSNEIVIKTTKIKDEDFNLDYIKDDNERIPYADFPNKLNPTLGKTSELKIELSREPLAREPLHRNNADSALTTIDGQIVESKPPQNHIELRRNPPSVVNNVEDSSNDNINNRNTRSISQNNVENNISQNPPQTLAERLRLAKINANKLAQTPPSAHSLQEKIATNATMTNKITDRNIELNQPSNIKADKPMPQTFMNKHEHIKIQPNEIKSETQAFNRPIEYIAQVENIAQDSTKDRVQDSDMLDARDDNISEFRVLSPNGEFILPSTDLLNKPIHQKIDIDDNESDLKANNLLSKLRVFKINGDVTYIYSGPVVTTFEFRPAPDVKVSRIQGLQDDLSMALKARSIRIQAPIPGKDVVGIEIPNNTIQTIYIREIFESEEFINSKANLAIALGKDITGKPIVQDLAKLPHLLIAGTTGSGKSVGLNGMILSLLYKNTPKDLRFIMIDPKRVELSLYKDIPHLLTPIIADSKKAVIALSKAVDEMNRRYEIMNEVGVKNIIGYNEIAQNQDLEKLPYIVIIIDEFADLMIMGGKDAEQYLISLASKARASGIHLIIATQRPTVNVVTGLIKSNLPSKISYRVGTQMDSKVILDRTGAESLLGNGDMLFSDTNSITRYHAPYSHEKEIERVANFIREQQAVEYDEFFSLEPKEIAQTQLSNTAPSTEEEYIQRAKEIILSSQKTSISYLQRALGIGFNKAASIVESLEKEGFLSPPNSKGLREIVSTM